MQRALGKELSMLDENAIQEAARRLASAARQPARIIHFGSYARGVPTKHPISTSWLSKNHWKTRQLSTCC